MWSNRIACIYKQKQAKITEKQFPTVRWWRTLPLLMLDPLMWLTGAFLKAIRIWLQLNHFLMEYILLWVWFYKVFYDSQAMAMVQILLWLRLLPSNATSKFYPMSGTKFNQSTVLLYILFYMYCILYIMKHFILFYTLNDNYVMLQNFKYSSVYFTTF